MALEGLKLAFLGMGVVFIFLVLQIYLIKFTSILLYPLTREEKNRIRSEQYAAAMANKPNVGPSESKTVSKNTRGKIAAIIAAIRSYRDEMK